MKQLFSIVIILYNITVLIVIVLLIYIDKCCLDEYNRLKNLANPKLENYLIWFDFHILTK